MTQTYANRGKKETARKPEAETHGEARPSQEALRAGTAVPTAEQKGHRVDLPEAMREKMESAFGADLSALKLYESEAVAEAGANAMAQGSEIAFAPGMLDFSSFGGQALLGHEISHVVSQARGEVTGGGFLNDHALEARADREGAMAAAGQTVAPPVSAVSGVTAAAAAGPMQAKKPWQKSPEPAPEPAPISAQHHGAYESLQSADPAARQAGYNELSQATAANTTTDEQQALTTYVAGSEPINQYLLGNTSHVLYPQASEIPRITQEMGQISSALGKNRIEEDTATYKGIEDSYFARMLQQAGLKRAVKRDGTVDHDWLEKHQKQLQKKMVGMTFSDPRYTSTTTERGFAQSWANKKNGIIRQQAFMDQHDLASLTPEQTDELERLQSSRDTMEGAHVIQMNLPAGSRAAAIDHAATYNRDFSGQSEILVDRNSQFRVSGVNRTSRGRYDIIMDLLEAGGEQTRRRR